MKILYVAHRYDYGDPSRGLSFEHYNLYSSLVAAGHDVTYFDFPTLAKELGVGEMNQRLRSIVRHDRPDLMFTVVWGDLLDRSVVRDISNSGYTTTLNWYCDDHWRFDSLSKLWTPCFNWVVTTAHSVLPRYEACGFDNVIASQWACNPVLYRRLDLPPRYDVTFVGLPHGNRPRMIDRLRQAGVRVAAFGHGWPEGRVSNEEMIRLFNQSRINLNFTAASAAREPTRLRRWMDRSIIQPMQRAPGVWRLADALRKRQQRRPRPAQIKARTFEVPACGGFLLTEDAENLSDYYRLGSEIVTFTGCDELVEKTLYYLKHEDKRQQIADAGYQRTHREHTYIHRFEEIFRRMGLQPAAATRRAA
jgi:spore maturation protein CgeB